MPAHCVLLVKQELLDAIGAKSTDIFEVLIGEGDDLGKIRLFANENGVTKGKDDPRYNAVSIKLGHVWAFPNRNEGSQVCQAQIVDDQLEIILPRWSEDIKPMSQAKPPPATVRRREPKNEEKRPQKSERPRSEPPPAPKAPPPPPVKPRLVRAPTAKLPAARAAETHNGIIIDFTPDNETISRDGKAIEVSRRGAEFISMLARVMPNQIGRSFVLGKMGLKGSMAEAEIDNLVKDLQQPLVNIGLKLTAMRGFGFCLSEVE